MVYDQHTGDELVCMLLQRQLINRINDVRP